MNRMIRFNVFHLMLWSVVAAGFLAVFLGFNAIANWGDNALKTVLLALLFVIGFGGDFLLRRRFKDAGDDAVGYEALRLKAMEISYILSLLYVFLAAISIYTRYEASGLVPVGWLWFLAYSLILVVHISASCAILFLHWKQKGPTP